MSIAGLKSATLESATRYRMPLESIFGSQFRTLINHKIRSALLVPFKRGSLIRYPLQLI